MKILFVAPYVYNPDINFTSYSTGFGIYVRRMAEKLATMNHEVSVLTAHNTTDGTKDQKVTYLKHKIYHSLYLFTNFKYLLLAYRLSLKLKKSKRKWKNILYSFYYAGLTGYIKKVLIEGNYDIVHIHSSGLRMIPFFYACSEVSVKVLLTLHDLRLGSELDSEDDFDAIFERRFLKLMADQKASISLISTGMLERIKMHLSLHQCSFQIILNGTEFEKSKLTKPHDFFTNFKFNKTDHIILYIGTIDKNKNQMQLINALKYIDNETRKKIKLLLLGENTLGNEIIDLIEKENLQSNVFVCGFIEPKYMSEFFKIAKYNVLISKREAFGLSIIESMSHGIPSLCFSDMDVIEDIYDERCMIKVFDRNEEALAEGLKSLLQKKWDKDFLLNYSRKFSLEAVMETYLSSYLDNNLYNISSKDILRLLK